MPKDLGAIKRLIGPSKRHVSLSVEAAKEIKQRPIDGDFEPLLNETRERVTVLIVIATSPKCCPKSGGHDNY